MITGAIIGVVAFLAGQILPRPHRRTKEPKAICGCGHALGFHKDKTGKCSHVTSFDRNECTCRHYDGPIPVDAYFAPKLLP